MNDIGPLIDLSFEKPTRIHTTETQTGARCDIALHKGAYDSIDKNIQRAKPKDRVRIEAQIRFTNNLRCHIPSGCQVQTQRRTTPQIVSNAFNRGLN